MAPHRGRAHKLSVMVPDRECPVGFRLRALLPLTEIPLSGFVYLATMSESEDEHD